MHLLGVSLRGGLWFGATLLTGIGVLGGELSLFNVVGLPFNGLLLYGPWVVWLAVWFFLQIRVGKIKLSFTSLLQPEEKAVAGWRERLKVWLTAGLFLALVVFVFSLLTRQLLTPLLGNDGTIIWYMKAKAFYLNGHIDLANLNPDQSHVDYPIAFPLAVTSIYLMGAGFQEQLGLALPGLFMLTGLALIYGYTRRYLAAWQSAGLTLALVALPAFLTLVNYIEALSQADFAESIAFLLFGIFFALWWEEENPAYLTVALLGTGLAASIKNEGLSFLALALLAIGLGLLLRPGLRKTGWQDKGPAIALAVTLAAVGGWKVFTTIHGYKNDVMSNFSADRLLDTFPQNYLGALGRFWDVVSSDTSYWFLGAMLVFSLIVAGIFRDKSSGAILILTGLIAGQLLSYLLTYVISPFHLVWLVDTTFFRLLGQLVP